MVAIPQFSDCQYEAPSTAILVCFLGLIFTYIGKTVRPFCFVGFALYCTVEAVLRFAGASYGVRPPFGGVGGDSCIADPSTAVQACHRKNQRSSFQVCPSTKQANKRPRLSSKALRHFLLTSLGLALSFRFASFKKMWYAARRSILGASTVGSFHAVDSGSAFRTHLPSRSFHRVLCKPRKHNAAATRVSARRKTTKKSSAIAHRVSNSPRHKSQQMTTAAMPMTSRL